MEVTGLNTATHRVRRLPIHPESQASRVEGDMVGANLGAAGRNEGDNRYVPRSKQAHKWYFLACIQMCIE